MSLEVRAFKDRLPNGLRVVTVELPHLHSASVIVYAKVGSRYETARDNGLSHFLEHMLFRGTGRFRDSYALNYAIEELGGTLYAETGRDYSLYQIALHPATLPRGVDILGDIFTAPSFRDLDLERRIILEEILEDQDEDGRLIDCPDIARAALWPDHPLGFRITGPLENVERFDAADCRRHFRRFYGARNLVLAVAGPVERAQVMEWAAKSFRAVPPGEEVVVVPPPDGQTAPRFRYVENEGSQTSVQILFRGIPELHPDYMALSAMQRTLDDGMSTRLHYRVCDQLGLAYYVAASIEPFVDTALLEIDAQAAHEHVPELVKECLRLCASYRKTRVEPREIDKAKARYRYDLEATVDEPDVLAGWFGGTELFYPPVPLAVKAARMQAVTAADVQRIARVVFDPARLTVACVGVLDGKLEARVRGLVESYR